MESTPKNEYCYTVKVISNDDDPIAKGWQNAPWQVVKFGPGVVGRTNALAIAGVGALCLAMYFLKENPFLILACVVTGAVGIALYMYKAFQYAESHPYHAVAEGAEIVKITEIQQAARNPEIIEIEAKTVTNREPPPAITQQGGASE